MSIRSFSHPVFFEGERLVIDCLLTLPRHWDGTLVVEPANRGVSEFPLLFWGDAVPGTGPAVLSFGWDPSVCHCDAPLLGVRGDLLSVPEQNHRYRCHFRVNRPIKTVLLEKSTGHHPPPLGNTVSVTKAGSVRPLPATAETDKNGHLTVTCAEELRPGEPYLLSYRPEFSYTQRHVRAVLTSLLRDVALAPGNHGLERSPSRVSLAGVSQTARLLNSLQQTEERFEGVWATLLYGAGDRGLDLFGGWSSHDGEAPIKVSETAGRCLSLFTAGETTPSNGIYLAGTPHGDGTGLELLPGGSANRVRLAELPPPQRDVTVRAYYQALINAEAPWERFRSPSYEIRKTTHAFTNRFLAMRKPEREPETAADVMGNETVGLRPIELRVPLATYLGTAFHEGEDGKVRTLPGYHYVIPASRDADPWGRPTLRELYQRPQDFRHSAEREIEAMVTETSILPEDAEATFSRITGLYERLV